MKTGMKLEIKNKIKMIGARAACKENQILLLLNCKDVEPSISIDKENEETSPNAKEDVEDVLASFRAKWQKELRISPIKQESTTEERRSEDQESYESRARELFLKGVEMEKASKLYEAIQYYKRAVQLVPDIEFKLDQTAKPKPRERQYGGSDDSDSEDDALNITDDSEDEELGDEELLSFIQRKIPRGSTLCFPKFEQQNIHIGQLPIEIILYVIRWIVSNDLDLRSLEMFGATCRGFYLCARDPEVWHLACLRVWGINCGPTPGIYNSWRCMFIERPRVHFNGCYISKTTYIRNGENSFQDQFYRPWHLVIYYRYLRFFPDGSVLMLTTADEPMQSVQLMKQKNARYPVLLGYYRLINDRLTIVVQRKETKMNVQVSKKKKREIQDNSEQTFHMEFQINSHHRKRHNQLIWTHYSVFTRTKKGEESTCIFELTPNRYPPLWFSRVKSFTAVSEQPLL